MNAFLKKLKNNHDVRRFFHTLFTRVKDSDINNSAVIVTYYLLLSLFPLIIAIGNILPFFNINPATVLPYLKEMVPAAVYSLIESTISNLLKNADGGLLSISAIATIWAASKSVNALQLSLNKIYGVENRVNAIVSRLFSFGMIFFLLVAIAASLLVFGLGQATLDYVNQFFTIPDDFTTYFVTLKWPVTIFILFFMMSVIYYFIPNAKVSIRYVFPGAIFTTTGWMLLTQAFGLYVKYFSKSMSSYGVIGSVMIFIIWLNFAATLILIGGIINAVLEEFLTGKIRQNKAGIEKIKKKLKKTID